MLLTFEPFLKIWGKMTERPPPFPIKGPCQQSCATPERSGVLSETEERKTQPVPPTGFGQSLIHDLSCPKGK